MIKVTKTKTFDTETASLIKKVTVGSFGDPAGYENTLYQTSEGDYFLYVNGGAESPFPTEKITSLCKAKALKWIEEN